MSTRFMFPALLILLCLTGQVLAQTEIVVDNTSATVSGSWSTGTAANHYGSNYLFTGVSGTKSVKFTPNLSAGVWDVYTWYPSFSSPTSLAPYTIRHAGGDTLVMVNQTSNTGTWVHLGQFTMTAGTGNFVQIGNSSIGGGKNVAADAVKFVLAAPDTDPPVISSVSSTPADTSAVITWTTDEPATSQVEYGQTTAYGSQTSKDSTLKTSHSVTVTGLDPLRLYHYRVKSEDGSANLAVSGDFTVTTLDAPPVPAEMRMMFAQAWVTDLLSASGIDSLINTIYNANFNAVIPQVRKAGDALYNSAYEPWATNIIDPPPFDPLQYIISKAKPLGIEVHPWIVAYRIWNTNWGDPPAYHIAAQRPDWFNKNTSGSVEDGAYRHLDPGVPGVQDYTCKVVLDIVSKYDIDGFNWDYIRYQGNNWGYNDLTKQRFYDEYGFWPPTSSSGYGWNTWCDYRRQQVTDLVKKCYLEVMAIKPHVKMTADTITWGDLLSGFEASSSYANVFQDWRLWMQMGILDATIPMNYKRDHDSLQYRDYRDWTDFAVNNRNGRHTYIAPAIYLNYISNSMVQLDVTRDKGADGIAPYTYHQTSLDEPWGDYWNTIKAQKFQNPAPIPEMPWKTNPTTGIIFGTVTDASKPNDPIYQDWIYKATVTVTGPVTRSTLTDATGTYGFLDLPPGTYSVKAEKTGFPTRTYANQTIAAGDVLRQDFDLGYTTITSPAGLFKPAKALLSVPLEPVNPDPLSVFAGIPIEEKLIRFNRANQSAYMYEELSVEEFGNINIDDGYWLYTSALPTISYLAYGGTPATWTTSLPRAGFSLIGVPFLASKEWSDVLVTKDGQTVSIEEASSLGWLSSVATGFNSVNQSAFTVGLEDDLPDTTALEPWHGYWIRSYVHDLEFTIR